MSDFDLTASRRYRARLAKQRSYQANYRAGLKAKKVPERDDVAGAALRVFLVSAAGRADAARGLIGAIAEDLTGRGFNEHATIAALTSMVDRYARASRRRPA